MNGPGFVGVRPGRALEHLADRRHDGREPPLLRAHDQRPADQPGEEEPGEEQDPGKARDGGPSWAESCRQAIRPAHRHGRRDGGDGPPEAVGHGRRHLGVQPVAEPLLGLALVHLVTSDSRRPALRRGCAGRSGGAT